MSEDAITVGELQDILSELDDDLKIKAGVGKLRVMKGGSIPLEIDEFVPYLEQGHTMHADIVLIDGDYGSYTLTPHLGDITIKRHDDGE